MHRILSSLILFPFVALAAPTEDSIRKLVEDVAAAIKADAPGTFKKINESQAPFVDPSDESVYAFVYDEKVNMVAHPKKNLVGNNFEEAPDSCGCKFRKEIVNRALGKTGNTGCRFLEDKEWVHYVYRNPASKAMEHKKTIFRKVTGSDGKTYIVNAGLFVREMKGCDK